MAKVIKKNIPFYTEVKVVDGSVHYVSDDSVENVYFIQDASGRIVPILTEYLRHLVVDRGLKAILTEARKIARFWSFLEENQMQWDYMPEEKQSRPTYAYFYYLKESIKEGALSPSTAKNLNLAAIQFYKFAILTESVQYSVSANFS